MRFKILILTIFFFWAFNGLLAQDEPDKKKKKNPDEIISPDFLLDQDSIYKSEPKKKKRKKKTFNKIKTKRGYTKRGSGRGQTIELIYYVKKHRDPDPYVSPIFLYDVKNLKIVKVNSYDPVKYPRKDFKIPHGPYVMRKGDLIMEEGYFWVGTMHNKWFKYSGEDMLVIERHDFHKGWPSHYDISYYDPQYKTKIREVNPINEFSENSGTYLFYYENGKVKTQGKLEKGEKVGKWYDFYTNGKKKTEYEHEWDAERKIQTIKILKEWDSNGKIKTDVIKEKEDEKKKNVKMKF